MYYVFFSRSECTRKKSGGRRINRLAEEQVLDDMERRNRLHPEKLKRRKEIIEHPFGIMKRSMNQGYFPLRGLKKVEAEMRLTVTARNLKRVLNILGGNQTVQPAPACRTGGVGLNHHYFSYLQSRSSIRSRRVLGAALGRRRSGS
jgi:hypothetical protein